MNGKGKGLYEIGIDRATGEISGRDQPSLHASGQIDALIGDASKAKEARLGTENALKELVRLMLEPTSPKPSKRKRKVGQDVVPRSLHRELKPLRACLNQSVYVASRGVTRTLGFL